MCSLWQGLSDSIINLWYQSMQEIDITEEGVHKLLRNLNPRKASGPDQVPARLLKELADELAPLLTIVFKKCLKYGETPHIWLSANVTAIFKKGDRFKASNYRPVSLTCLCCKVLEHIVVSNVMKHLDQQKLLTDCQHGFRARRSCETQLISLIHELASSLDRKKQHDIAVLDFSKAFDRVPHERLLAKLHHYGVRGNTHRWIRSFLTGRSQRVVVHGAFSSPAPVVSGVPQGSVLGPILFLVFINDLPECVSSCTRLFADDCVLYREINSAADCDILQQDLAHLEEWEQKWGMDFHPDKCSILRVHRKRDPLLHNYSLKGHILASEQHTKYLGVLISQDLTWTTHINTMVKKANSVLGFLRRNLRVSNEHTKEAAYKTLVRPHLEYCCTVWNPHTKDLKHRVEMVQRRAARFTTRRYRNTNSVSEMLWTTWAGRPWKRVEPKLHSPCYIKWSTILWTYQPPPTWLQAAPGPDPPTLSNSDSSNAHKIPLNTVSFQQQWSSGTLYQPLWLRFPTWHPSSGGYPQFQSSFLVITSTPCLSLEGITGWGLYMYRCLPLGHHGCQAGLLVRGGK